VWVNAVLLEKEKVLRTARAEAGLLRARAVSEAGPYTPPLFG